MAARGDETGSAEARVEVLRIVQEALQNALRHSSAERLDVFLDADEAMVGVRGVDDGSGLDLGAPGFRARRLGLTSMEERARPLGGGLSISSRPGEGTTIALEVPS